MDRPARWLSVRGGQGFVDPDRPLDTMNRSWVARGRVRYNVLLRRQCAFVMSSGRPCGAPPGRSSTLCYWHDPDRADDLAEAQRVGGMRRKRERTIAAAYNFNGLDSVDAIRRLFEIAATDVLHLENSIARARVLVSAGLAGIKLIEVGDHEERLRALEAAQTRATDEADAFPDIDP